MRPSNIIPQWCQHVQKTYYMNKTAKRSIFSSRDNVLWRLLSVSTLKQVIPGSSSTYGDGFFIFVHVYGNQQVCTYIDCSGRQWRHSLNHDDIAELLSRETGQSLSSPCTLSFHEGLEDHIPIYWQKHQEEGNCFRASVPLLTPFLHGNSNYRDLQHICSRNLVSYRYIKIFSCFRLHVLLSWSFRRNDIAFVQFVFVEDKNLRATLLEDIDDNQLPEIYGGKLPLVPIQDPDPLDPTHVALRDDN